MRRPRTHRAPSRREHRELRAGRRSAGYRSGGARSRDAGSATGRRVLAARRRRRRRRRARARPRERLRRTGRLLLRSPPKRRAIAFGFKGEFAVDDSYTQTGCKAGTVCSIAPANWPVLGDDLTFYVTYAPRELKINKPE
jgi:hypothetical protein